MSEYVKSYDFIAAPATLQSQSEIRNRKGEVWVARTTQPKLSSSVGVLIKLVRFPELHNGWFLITACGEHENESKEGWQSNASQSPVHVPRQLAISAAADPFNAQCSLTQTKTKEKRDASRSISW